LGRQRHESRRIRKVGERKKEGRFSRPDDEKRNHARGRMAQEFESKIQISCKVGAGIGRCPKWDLGEGTLEGKRGGG